jgi:nucleoside-diphosphate-sugar epimerase
MSSISNVLITGGTGFVGNWMQEEAPENFFVNCIGQNQYDFYKSLGTFDYIAHLAPIAPTRVLEIAKKNNARLLYASSGAVYHPEYQDKEYRENKIRWEQECLDSGVDVVIARLFTFARSSRAYNRIFSDIRTGHKPTVARDCVRSFMYPREMARWMWAILLRGESGQAYDVGSDRATSMVNLALRIHKFTGVSSMVSHEPVPMPHYLPPNTAKTRALL